MDYLCHSWVLLRTGDGFRGAELSSAIMNLLFGKEEKLMDGLGGGGVAERNVYAEVGSDFVVCSPWRWDGMVLRLN